MSDIIDQIHQRLLSEGSNKEVDTNKPIHAVASILLSASYSDLNFGQDEIKEIIRLLDEEFISDDEDRKFILSMSIETVTDPVKFEKCIEAINTGYSVKERMRILAMAWKIMIIDEVLTKGEQELALSLEKKLKLTPEQGLEARQLVSEKLI